MIKTNFAIVVVTYKTEEELEKTLSEQEGFKVLQAYTNLSAEDIGRTQNHIKQEVFGELSNG